MDTNEQTTTPPVTFSPEQTKSIETLIEQSITRTTGRHQQEVERLKAEHEKALKDAVEAARKEAGKGAVDDAERTEFKSILDAQKRETEAQKVAREAAEAKAKEVDAKSAKILKRVAVRDAINGQDSIQFVDADVVHTLTSKYVHLDDETGEYIVKEDSGAVRKNASLQPMTLKEFYADFAVKHPYLVVSRAKNGTSAGESHRSMSGGLAKVTSKADLKDAKEKIEYIKKFGGDAFAALPTK